MAEEKNSEVEKVIEEYNNFKEKYPLPSWDDLEKDFDLSRTFKDGSGLILRDVRRRMNDKIGYYLSLFETFLNPQSTQIFVLNTLKKLDESGWTEIKRIHKILAKTQLRYLVVDIIYSEEKEAELIRETSKIWNEEKEKILSVLKTLEEKYLEDYNDKQKSYFG